MRIVSVGMPKVEPKDDCDSAWDPNFDPHYDRSAEGQAIDSPSGSSFEQLRSDMNDRRRQTARRVEGSRRYY